MRRNRERVKVVIIYVRRLLRKENISKIKIVPMEKKTEKQKLRGRENLVKGERKSSPIRGIKLRRRLPPRRKKRQMRVVEMRGRAKRKPFLIE